MVNGWWMNGGGGICVEEVGRDGSGVDGVEEVGGDGGSGSSGGGGDVATFIIQFHSAPGQFEPLATAALMSLFSIFPRYTTDDICFEKLHVFHEY